MASNDPLKILYVIPDYNFFSLDRNKIGGHIAHIIGVIAALQKRGHKVIVCSYDKIPFYDHQLEYIFFKHKPLKLRKLDELIRHYTLSRQLKNFIKGTQPDLVYIRWSLNLFWNLAFKHKNYKLIFECNTPVSMLIRRGIKKLVAKNIDAQICKNADLISAVSKEVKEFLLAEVPYAKEAQLIVNPNGVDPNRFKPEGKNLRAEYSFSNEDIVIGFSGNFSFWHGIEELIKAFAELKPEIKNLKLLLIGTGEKSYLKQLEELAQAAGSRDIIFTGAVSFELMPDYLRSCDILVSPQKVSFGKVFHGSPTKLFEYMAAGRPLITSNIGQMKEIIQDAQNGLLFKSGDSTDLAAKIKLLAENPSLRTSLAANARKEALAKHSWDNNVERILSALGKGP
jgi:glycosyltransferase involved in cell wall biosynthesis